MPAGTGGSQALAQRVAPRVVSLPSLPTQPVNSQSGHLVDEGLGTLSTLMGMGNAHGVVRSPSPSFVSLDFSYMQIRLLRL